MFDHLDDDPGFRPDDTFRAATMRRGRRLRRRRRAATGVSVGSCSLLLALGGILRWADEKLDDVDRVEIANDVMVRPGPGEPTNFLVVGVDQPRPVGEPAGATDGQPRADAIMVVRAAPDGRLSVLSVPRDLWVSDDGVEDRINGALARGGRAELIAMIDATLGVPINHYVELDFEGFATLIDEVGGVPLDFPAPMRDTTTGLAIEATGCQQLGGNEALALARSRHLVVRHAAGTWTADPTSDLGRSARQRVVAGAAVRALVDLEPTAADLEALIDVLADHAVLDEGLTNGEVLDWGRWLISRGESNLTEYALPVESGTVGSAAVLFLGDGWETVVAEFEAGQPQSTPASVTGEAGTSIPAPVVPALCD